jgi:hypothetical protein
MDGIILNSLCLLTHIRQSIQPSLSNGTSALLVAEGLRAIAILEVSLLAGSLGDRCQLQSRWVSALFFNLFNHLIGDRKVELIG